jgi:RNA polymerase sigma-70 factor, ECF subfamily
LVVRRFLKRTVKGEFSSEASVEDLVQEVLLTIHRKRGLYQRGQPILPWIKTITRYRLIDSIRSSQRRPEFVGFDENFDEAVSAESTPDLQAEAEELMAPLSEKQKEVLKLAKLEGLSHAEISSRTGLSIAAVKVSIHRSLNQIRKSLYEKK